MNIFLITSLILFTLITIYRTRLGIYLILILIPTFLIRTQIGPIPTTFLELAIYLLAIIWLLKKVKKYLPALPTGRQAGRQENWKLKIKNFKLKIKSPYLLPTALFITAFIISTIISPDKRLSLGILKAWLFDPLLFTIIFIDQINPRIYSWGQKHINRVITSLALMVAWVSLYGIYEYFINPRNLIEYSRLDSIFTSANYVTMLTVPPTILILGYLIKLGKQFNNETIKQCNNGTIKSWSHGFMVSLLILTTSISLATIYLTRSYSGYLGLAAGILILLILLPTKKKSLKTDIIIILTALSIIFIYTQRNNPKIQALTNFKGRTAIHSRIQIWKTSYNIIKDNPIIGIGLGNFNNAYTNYLLISVPDPLEYNVIKPHNLYLNLWLETGILGLIAFLWLIIVFYKENKKYLTSNISHPTSDVRCKMLDVGVYAAMTALLIQGLFDTPYFKNDLSLIFWLLIGLAIINRKLVRESLPSP